MNARKVTTYACGCVLDAAVTRVGGLTEPPHPPLICPVHGAIWINARTTDVDDVEPIEGQLTVEEVLDDIDRGPRPQEEASHASR